MAEEISESHWIHSKFVTGGLFRSQITNLQPHYKNLKWRLQYGGRNFQNSLESLETCTCTVRFMLSWICNTIIKYNLKSVIREVKNLRSGFVVMSYYLTSN